MALAYPLFRTVEPLSPYLPENLRRGLVLYLWMNEGSGNKVYDLSGNGNHGTIYGATWTRLASGKNALYFDGVDDYIETGLVGYKWTSPKNGWTIMCWVKIDSGGALFIDNRGPEGQGHYSLTLFIDRFFHFNVPAYYAQFGIDRDYVWRGVYFKKDLRNEWHHLVGVFRSELYNPSAPENAMEVWVDGEKSTTPTPMQVGNGIPFDTWSTMKYFINYHRAWNTYGRCVVSNVLIYNRALSDAEIRTLYDLHRGLFVG